MFLPAKSEGIRTKLKDVQDFISSRTERQQLKESKHTKQSNGHIVSYSSFNRLQLDIFVLKKFNIKSLIDTTPAMKSFLALLDYMNIMKMHWLSL